MLFSDFRTFGLSDFRTFGLSDFRTFGLSDFRTFGLKKLLPATAGTGIIRCSIILLLFIFLKFKLAKFVHQADAE